MTPSHKRQCMLIDKFTFGQKLLMRFLWYGFIGVGTVGIFIHSVLWATIYLLFTIFTFACIVSPVICSRCPYPYQHDTCLFMPDSVMRRLYSPRQTPIPGQGLVMAGISLVIIIAAPQYWLADDRILLLLFWLLCLPGIGAFPFFYCKRCRHSACPMNRAELERISGD